MLKKFIFWTPLFVLLSICLDMYVHWADTDHRSLAITAMMGWLFYWDALNDLYKIEKETDTDAQS
jgi:hypothetical protein